MRRPENHHPAMTVPQLHEVFAVADIAAGLLPKFQRLKRRQQNLGTSDGVHLLADDLRRLLQAAQSQRQKVISPGGQLTNQPRSNHELMADDLGIGRVFLLSRDERLAPTHSCFPFNGLPITLGVNQ